MATLRRVLALLLLGAAQPLAAQDTKLAGFAQLELEGTDRRTDAWTFALEQVDLYLTSHLANHISFLSEIVFEYRGGPAFVSDVERMIVTFTPRSYFRVSVGKFHTPIGFWNTAYHEGTLLFPTIDRPVLFTFGDDGGVLPLNTIGLQLWGRDISTLHLGYDVSVGNGIGATPVADNSNAKAVTVALHSQVTSALRIGASLYLDHIAAGTPSLSGTPLTERVKQRIVGGFVVYQGQPWEAAGEWQRVTNSAASGSSGPTDGFYVYAGYRTGRVTGYGRYEELRFPGADPYFLVDDARLALAGIRYDFGPTAAIRVEGRRRRTASAGSVTEWISQVAVGF
jgi:hypothetical protein